MSVQKEDVLIGDFKVTVLADEGTHVFEWVSKDDDIVTFDKIDSDVEETTDNVISAINQNGLEVKENVEKSLDSLDIADEENEAEKNNENEFEETTTIETDEESEFSNTDQDSDTISKNTESETISYIIQVESEENKDVLLESLPNKFDESKEKLQMVGPYKVTYEIYGDGTIELDSMEDLGI